MSKRAEMSLGLRFRRTLKAWTGRDLIRPEWFAEEAMHEHLRKVFQAYGIQCVIDVGANAGQYAQRLRRSGYDGWIISIEPQTAVFERLSAAASAAQRWITLNCALGSTEGTAEFYVLRSSEMSSLLTPGESQTRRFAGDETVVGTETVRVRRLDAVLHELGNGYPLDRCHLKIDTQGHDLEALKGAGTCLSLIRTLQTELSYRPQYVGQPSAAEVFDFLTAAGFDYSYSGWINDDEALRAIERDGVFVNRRFAERLMAR